MVPLLTVNVLLPSTGGDIILNTLLFSIPTSHLTGNKKSNTKILIWRLCAVDGQDNSDYVSLFFTVKNMFTTE